MKSVFTTNNFYCQYRVPNVEELTNALNKYTTEDIDNSNWTWGDQCDVERIPLKWEEYYNLLQPSVNAFATQINANFNYTMYNPWLNLYNRGQFQDVHAHNDSDFSCVFFVNNEEKFSKFYFQDRNPILLTRLLNPLVHYEETHIPDIKSGDILFFPSHMLHAASPHQSDITRKTFAANFTINE